MAELPFDSGRLDVGDGHVLYYEEVGRRDGLPIVYIHGGPGSGCTPAARENFVPARHRAVLFDQRGAGRSTPHASEEGVNWATIDMDRHVADLEQLRERLRIERWVVFGISWGSVLGLTYAERHPEQVVGAVFAAVSTGTAADVEWLTVHSGRFFPAEWREFANHVPTNLRDRRLVDAYRTLLMDTDPAIRDAAALAWCRWEEAHMAGSSGPRNPRYDDARFRLGFARQVTHCWSNDSWLSTDEIVANAHRLGGIPGWLIHGRLDVSSPVDSPWRIHQSWPGSELILVDDEGHGGDEMRATWRRVLADLG
jgi:proline iminopeptidase